MKGNGSMLGATVARFKLRRHAMGTGLYGFNAAPFYPGPLDVEYTGIYDAAGHEDVQVPEGTPFALPVGVWVCTQHYIGDGWGWTIAFRPQFLTHEVVFMHMDTVADSIVLGGTYRGGQLIGTSGGVPGVSPGVTAQHSGGAHLHIAYSDDVKLHAYRHYGRRAFVSGINSWYYGEQTRGGGPFSGGATFRRGHTSLI